LPLVGTRSSTQVEIRPGEYTYLPIERVHFGPDSITRLRAELDRLGSETPLVITGKTIASNTDLVSRLEKASGRKVAVFSEIKQHTPASGVERAVKAAKAGNADSLISLGGGSPIDATKVVVKELSEDFSHETVPHLAVPTTLSAAEFSHSAGVTDEKLNRKTGFRDVRMTPRIVFLDPKLTSPTPSWLWASTGMRSLDHAVEAICSPKHQPYVDTLAFEAIRLLFQDLKASSENPADLGLRTNCQLAAWMSYAGALSVGTGLSHAIGRTIGATWNIPHGITSCLTLAEVMRVQAGRIPMTLALIASAEGANIEGVSAEKAAELAADRVAELVRELGLAKKLRDYGVPKGALVNIASDVGQPEEYATILKILEKIW
jgi:maleylacetate reductase